MASTRPNWSLNFPSGPTWHEQWWDFNSERDLGDFAIDVRGGDGAEQCAWKGSVLFQDGRLGEVLITNDDNDNDYTVFQSKVENIRFNSLGKTTWIVFRLKVSDDDQVDWIAGAWKRSTTPFTLISDGVFFSKDDGDDDLDAARAFNAATRPDDYSQETNIQAVAADTYMVLAIRVIMDSNTAAVGSVTYYVDGTAKYTAGPSASICNDEELAVGVAIQNGEAVAKTMTIDTIGIIQER